MRHTLGSLRAVVGWIFFVTFVLSVAVIVYSDDIQIVGKTTDEVPTIYNLRLFGIKIIDGISLLLFALLVLYLILREKVPITPFHKNVGVIVLVYCYAGLVGLVYSFFFQYDYLIWLQDFQYTIYFAGFFLLTFHVLDSKTKWNLFMVALIVFMAAKNFVIVYLSLTGVGKAIGDWAFRASQNSEFTYFPMMFFPILLLFLKRKNFWLRLVLALVMLVYLFNSLIGIYRTVWVMLILGTAFLLTQIDTVTRFKILFMGGLGLAVTLSVISFLLPRFIQLAWNFKFASIFDWSVHGDRSNSTRILEVVNVTHYLFRHFSFLQGMGLGAWWDDEARRLLPDFGSGFTYKTRFHETHMWYITQMLKLGFVAMSFYWMAIFKIFRRVLLYARGMSWDRWEKAMLLGLMVGLVCGFISSACFVRLFLVIGINIGLTASFIHLDEQEQNIRLGSARAL